jgi:hypothetical protein
VLERGKGVGGFFGCLSNYHVCMTVNGILPITILTFGGIGQNVRVVCEH